jgi:hypothetical protein
LSPPAAPQVEVNHVILGEMLTALSADWRTLADVGALLRLA